jgi:RimJ/RimL family protein N-acetyltransferase
MTLRAIENKDISLIEKWLAKDHVRPWFTEPDEWLREVRERDSEFSFIRHFIALLDGKPFAFCQYYACADALEEDYAMYAQDGLYSIDYMIGEEEWLGKGHGKAIVRALLEMIFAIPGALMAVAKPDAGNAASRGTLEACGFTLDAVTGVHVFRKTDML